MTSLPSYAGPFERIWYYVFRVLCGIGLRVPNRANHRDDPAVL